MELLLGLTGKCEGLRGRFRFGVGIALLLAVTLRNKCGGGGSLGGFGTPAGNICAACCATKGLGMPCRPHGKRMMGTSALRRNKAFGLSKSRVAMAAEHNYAEHIYAEHDYI